MHEKPHELLDEDCWQTLLEIGEVYEAEKAACEQSFESIEIEHEILQEAKEKIICPICYSDLIKAGNTKYFDMVTPLNCQSCGEHFEFGDVISECFSDYKHLSHYEEVFAYCNNCEYTKQPSVVPTNVGWFCISCNTIHEHNEVGYCGYCNTVVAGNKEDSYMQGCLKCDGQMGHYLENDKD